MCYRRRNEGGRECASHPAGSQPSGRTNTVDPASTVAHRRQKPPAAVVVRTSLAMDFTTDSSQPNSGPSPPQTNAVKQHSRFPLASKISPPNQSSRSAFLTSPRAENKKKKKRLFHCFRICPFCGAFSPLYHRSRSEPINSDLLHIIFGMCVWRKGREEIICFCFKTHPPLLVLLRTMYILRTCNKFKRKKKN